MKLKIPRGNALAVAVQKEVKKLAIDLERPRKDLLEETMGDLLKKYGKNGQR